MYDEKTRDTLRAPSGSIEDVRRMDLIRWRFSAAEIERLIKWQQRYREGQVPRDLPLDAYRLHFARWLVERGKLSEGVGHDREIQDEALLYESLPPRNERLSSKYTSAPHSYIRPTHVYTLDDVRDRWRHSLLRLMTRLRENITRRVTDLRTPSRP